MKRMPMTFALLIAALPVAADPMLGDARKVASEVPPKLLAVLAAEIEKGGPANAIEVCREQAPKMAQAASQASGWSVRRVSLRNRNPKAVPDAWERATLEEFDRRAGAGEDLKTLEKGAWVGEGADRKYRYMKALPTMPLCLQCHGAEATLSQPVRDKLHALYPVDRATGYGLNQIRGAMTLSRAR